MGSITNTNSYTTANAVSLLNDTLKPAGLSGHSSAMNDNIDKKTVTFVKSFKNSSGHYKIDGEFENIDSSILADVKLIKYLKVKSFNNTVVVCDFEILNKCQLH
ncbi:MAG: hypothetical protein M3162_00715 [Thermoproteota archaeon]|nr:hypothetical protein [Thermoproteota archaeon]